MSNEMVQHSGTDLVPAEQGGPLARMLQHGVNAGAVAIESERAVAEARGQIQLAKMFPRSMSASITEFMDACKSIEFAESAFYSVPNRGSGPSIRFAEEAARCYGNFEYGHRELSRSAGKSEVQVYAWDKEKNNFSPRQISVMHVTDTRNGPKTLTDQTDIDNRIANVASKQMRGRILALLPKHMVAAGIAECKRTLAGNNDKPLSQRVIAMAQAFSRFGVTDTHLVKHLGHSVDDTTLDELADLTGIFNAIKEGSKAGEYFDITERSESGTIAAALTDQAKKSAPAAEPAKADKKAGDGKKVDAEKVSSQASKKSNPSEGEGKSTQEQKAVRAQKTDTQLTQQAEGGPPDEPAAAEETKENAAASPEQGDDVF